MAEGGGAEKNLRKHGERQEVEREKKSRKENNFPLAWF